jgi:Macrocin-O-methyltransferase (TylF)
MIDYYYLPTNVKLIKGDVNETVPIFLEENKHVIVSLLYLDLDIYEPTKTSLKYFLPKMAKGSIIAFDELNWKSFPGETIAVLEELGTKYKFVNLLNSQINYCVIE